MCILFPDMKTPSPHKAMTESDDGMQRIIVVTPVAGGDINPACGKSSRHSLVSGDSDESQSSAEVYKCGVQIDIAEKNWSRNRRRWWATSEMVNMIGPT